MCGIFGYALTRDAPLYKDVKYVDRMNGFMGSMFITGMLRGMNGSGIYTGREGYTMKNGTRYFKRGVHGLDFLEFAGTKELLRDKAAIKVGHLRAATVGNTSNMNSHPFMSGATILVHNGTLTNWRGLSKENVNVDSHAMTNAIEEHGLEKALAEKIEGDYSLAVYNMDEDVFSLIRNEGRPLAVAILKKRQGLIFASEQLHLKWLLDRCDLNENVERIELPKAGTLITVTDNIKHRQVELKPKHIVYQNTYRPPVYGSAPGTGSTERNKQIIPVNPVIKTPKEGDVILCSPNYSTKGSTYSKQFYAVEFRGVGPYSQFKFDYYPTDIDAFIAKYKIEDGQTVESEWYQSMWLASIDCITKAFTAAYTVVQLTKDETRMTGNGSTVHLTRNSSDILVSKFMALPHIQALCGAVREEAEEERGGVKKDVKYQTLVLPEKSKTTKDGLPCGWCDDVVSDEDRDAGRIDYMDDTPMHPECYEHFLESINSNPNVKLS